MKSATVVATNVQTVACLFVIVSSFRSNCL